jgi:hypothetical protein
LLGSSPQVLGHWACSAKAERDGRERGNEKHCGARRRRRRRRE